MSEQSKRRLEHFLRIATATNNIEPEKEILSFCPTKGSLAAPSDDDVVIISAYRTPLTKAKRGGFKDTHVTDLLIAVLKVSILRILFI